MMLSLILSLRLLCGVPGDCPRYPLQTPPVRVTVDPVGLEQWAHVIAGETSGQWETASRLVAWTLRAWQLYQHMRPRYAGPLYGWYGWRSPTQEAYDAAREAWGQPLSASPFAFMRDGHYCRTLGSAADLRYWRTLGPVRDPDYVLALAGTDYRLNCFFALPWN